MFLPHPLFVLTIYYLCSLSMHTSLQVLKLSRHQIHIQNKSSKFTTKNVKLVTIYEAEFTTCQLTRQVSCPTSRARKRRVYMTTNSPITVLFSATLVKPDISQWCISWVSKFLQCHCEIVFFLNLTIHCPWNIYWHETKCVE